VSLDIIAQKFEPNLFINATQGIQNTLGNTEESKAALTGASFGFQYGFGKHISGNLQFDFPFKDKYNADITMPTDNLKIVLDFQYRT